MAKSRWLEWKPGDSIIGNSPSEEPKEPKKPGCLGLLGSKLTSNPIIKEVTLDGHKVRRVIWQTDKAMIFADEQGQFWRYLQTYKKAWPVVIEGNKK